MIWLRYAFAVAAILITGRIHSKRLDEQDEPDARGYPNALLMSTTATGKAKRRSGLFMRAWTNCRQRFSAR